MKTTIVRFLRISAAVLLINACTQTPVSDYQAFLDSNPQRVLLILNGGSENISAIDPGSGEIYNNLQRVGYSTTNSAIPSDIMVSEGKINVLLSGQNSLEGYDNLSLDYIDSGRHYFKKGYNPMSFIPVPGTNWVFVSGLETDDVQIVNLDDAGTGYSFESSFAEVAIAEDAHQETKAAATLKNAVGDNHARGCTGGAVLEAGSSSRLFVTNVRQDGSILLTDGDALAVYPALSGDHVSAGGYFREATLSIFSFDSEALITGASDSAIAFQLVKEISLEDIISAAMPERSYYPGDGLNPQSAFILDGYLNIICTGTNGGTARTFTADEYLPSGFSIGDVKPGTDADDGIILVLDISSPDNPVYLTHLEIGGSPVGFREGTDSDRKIVYLAGVGGVQSYRYGTAESDYEVLHSSEFMILTAEEADTDYYSGLCYDEPGGVLYISYYTGDQLKSIHVTGSAASPVYSDGSSWQTGDGPGALTMLSRD